VALIPFGGSWPVLDGLMIAWGLLHHDAQLRFFGVLPLRGRHLVWLTLAGTGLYALFYGLAPFVPHFAAELLVLLWLGLIPRARAAQHRARAENWSFDKWLERERRR
jgi:hypothetical protein